MPHLKCLVARELITEALPACRLRLFFCFFHVAPMTDHPECSSCRPYFLNHLKLLMPTLKSTSPQAMPQPHPTDVLLAKKLAFGLLQPTPSTRGHLCTPPNKGKGRAG
eukprot:1146313-Pelagomonas_calceolata.AAC.1